MALGLFAVLAPGQNKWLVALIIMALIFVVCCNYTVAVEFGCELSYPVPEETSSGIVVTFSQIPQLLMIGFASFMFDAPSLNPMDSVLIINLICCVMSALGTLLVCFIKGE